MKKYITVGNVRLSKFLTKNHDELYQYKALLNHVAKTPVEHRTKDIFLPYRTNSKRLSKYNPIITPPLVCPAKTCSLRNFEVINKP